jgi:hypothetical protein
MTDTFGEPHNLDGEEPLENETRAMDTPTAAPTDDEFYGPPPEELEGNEGPRNEKPRRSAWLPITAAVGGIVLLGGVAWWQLGSQAPQLMNSMKQPAPQLSVASATPANAPKTDSSAQQKEAEAASQSLGGFASAPGALPDSAQKSKPPENIMQAVPLAPVVPGQTGSPVPKLVPQTPAAPQQTSEEANRRIDALTARIDSLQKALDQANQQLGQMNNNLAASSDTTAARLAQLEQRLEKPKRSAQVQAAPVASDAGSEESVHRASSRHKKSRAHKEVGRNTETTSRFLNEPAKSWVLRAASPDRAWVSESPTSKDLREIRVGDKVPGIGKVMAIEPLGDSWIVQGSKNSIQ